MLFLPFAVGLVIALGIGGIWFALKVSDETSRKERALSVIRGHAEKSAGGSKSERSLQDKRRAEIAKKLKESGDFDTKPRKNNTAVMLEQAGLTFTVKQFWIGSLALGVILTLVAMAMSKSPFVALMVFVVGFLGIPRFVLKFRIGKRRKKFLEEFADALEAMVRLLKAGMPITEAIHMSAKEFDGPVGEEMSRIYDAQKIGISLPEAALSAAKRMPVTEMQMFATGMAIQQQTGASLSEVLMNLAGVIRARFRLKRKVVALSSEAKSSAMIIGSLPFLIGGGLFLINPDYMNVLFTTGVGKVLLFGSAVWMAMGIFVMKIMINFKI